MRMFNHLLFATSLVIVVAISLTSCKSENKNQQDTITATIQAPAFDADSAFQFVKKQTDFGPRVPNSDAHEKCADYLFSQLSKYCDTAMNQGFTAKAYDGTVLHGRNLIGSFGIDKAHRVLLAAHWDSRHVADHDPVAANRNKPIDGANDGASGVGVLLEVARQLSLNSPEIGIDIIFFDAEDYGAPEGANAPDGEWWGLGSQYWSNNFHIADYQADYGILLDMVGGDNASFRYEYFSANYAPDILNKVWTAAYQIGFDKFFITEPSNPITDDHYYVNTIAGIPMIDIIHQDDHTGTGFIATWHTTNDNISHINKNTLSAVGKTLLYVLYNEKFE